jgi:hypothetical protein
MHLPYTDDYPGVVGTVAVSVTAALGAVLWNRPLPRRASNGLFFAGIATTAAVAFTTGLTSLLGPEHVPTAAHLLELGATLATLAFFFSKLFGLGVLALSGQVALLALGSWVRGSDNELMFAHLLWYGTLLGAYALSSMPGRHRPERPPRLSYPMQDAVIFLFAIPLALFVTDHVYEWSIYNGDEIANTFQANLYAHLRAYADVPPCPTAFANYWVFTYHGRVFAQYTPGWPLFMALFDRMHADSLAGPVMGGIGAVGIAHLARRLASGLGATYESSERIVAVAGPLAATLSLLGPSLLLNAASRFSHTMVVACFAWAVEGAAEVATPRLPRGRALAFGLLLGSATSLGLATRPADGGFLGVGVFLYFSQALLRRRVSVPAFVGTCIAFLFFGGLTAVILRLQLGTWFTTGYAVTKLYRPEGILTLAFPSPYELRFGVPLATGSYCWWPIAPALAAVGLVRALGGRARGVTFMLVVSCLGLVGFYTMATFGRWVDDGLGPRFELPIVVAQGAGTGACLAPLVARLFERVRTLEWGRLLHAREYGPGLLALAAAAFGVVQIAPHVYPVAYAEYHQATTPVRAARQSNLKNAIVMIYPQDAVQGWWNVNQNPPMEPNPDVLILGRFTPEDEICAREKYPTRTIYRVFADGTLKLLSAPRR